MYHKPTHTDQYLQWDSHHNVSTKYSVIGTITHRAKTVCTKPELLQKELSHLREALVKSKYPPWAINRVQSKLINNNWGIIMMTTTSRMVQTIPVQLQLKAIMETIHCRTKAWTQKLPQQAGPWKTKTTTQPIQQTQQVQ